MTVRALTALTLTTLLLPSVAPAQRKAKKDLAVAAGTVTDKDKQPLVGIQVTVTSDTDPSVRYEATTDRKGNFLLKIADPEGEYVFRLEAEGYAPFEGKASLVAGEQTNLGFELLDAAAGRRAAAVKAYNVGAEAFNRNDLDAAKAGFREAIELDPEIIEAYQGLAGIYYREKNLEEAAAAVDKVLETKGDDPDILSLAYTIHRDLGNAARTEELIEALAETDKAKPLARSIYNEGVAAAQAGDSAQAVERFRRASSLDSELAPAYAGEATILYNQQRYDEALAAVDRLLALDPANAQGRRIRFLVYDALDDRPKAAAALDAYLEVDVDGAVDVWYQRADLDFRGGDRAKAAAALERILEVRPDFARAHYTLGLCYTQDEPAKAKVHFEKFLALAPDDPEAATARELLAQLPD